MEWKSSAKSAALCALILGFSLLKITVGNTAERILMAALSPGLTEFPVVTAMKKGYFRDEGLEVLKIQMSPQVSVMALVAGNVDYSLSWGSSVRAAITGVPIKVVAGMAAKPLIAFVSRPEIKSGKDLKGKRIGIDSFAGTMDYLARVALRHYGLEPDKDVQFIISGPSPTRVAALQAGAIDATPVDVAFALKGEEQGLKLFINLADLTELPISGLAVHNKKLETQKEQIKKVLRAMVRGVRFMKSNREETVRIMAEYLAISSSQAARAYDLTIHSFTDDGMISDKGFKLNLQLTKQRLNLTKDVPIEQVADWSLIREVNKELGR